MIKPNLGCFEPGDYGLILMDIQMFVMDRQSSNKTEIEKIRMNNIVSLFMFSRCDYEKVKQDAWEENWKAMRLYSVVALVAFGVITLLSAVSLSIGKYKWVYLAYTFLSLLYFCISRCQLRSFWGKELVVYSFFAALLLFGIITGTLITPEELTVNYIVFMMVAPLLFTARTAVMNGLILSSMLLYIGLAFFTQYNPILSKNLVNVILYGVLSMLLTATMMRSKLQRILYQKEKETLEISKAEEQKQKQLLMNAAEEAESASKAKSAFLLSISHDIRTPMNAIIGFTNIALHQNKVSDIHDSLEKVQKSSNHLLSLLNDVLDFTRIESGKVTISPEPVDITELTDNVVAIMNGLLYNRDLKFEVHRERPENPYVLADVVRIREVLVNLLGNAVKFTKDGGKITLDISSQSGTDEKHIITRYVVRDNGIGMSEEFQKELFKPFSQEDNANARTQYKGTGLGMAITKKYVDMMGGSIAVESKKGAGSTFTVEIPMELAEQVIQSEQKQPLHRDLTGVHVLMAEDNDLNAELATIMLEDAGMTVTRASDGEEVVNLFKNHPRGTYDLILMDIMMPNMDGHQATKAIRALGIEQSDAVTIPIIALSANAFIDDVQESLDSGMNDHISKPINMEVVTDTIAKYIKDDTCLEKELKQKQNDR